MKGKAFLFLIVVRGSKGSEFPILEGKRDADGLRERGGELAFLSTTFVFVSRPRWASSVP